MTLYGFWAPFQKNILEAIRKWLDGRGWKEIYEYSTINTAGKKDAGNMWKNPEYKGQDMLNR